MFLPSKVLHTGNGEKVEGFSFELRRAQERGRSTFEGVLDNVRRVQWSEVKRGKLARCNVQHQVHHRCVHRIKRGALQMICSKSEWHAS